MDNANVEPEEALRTFFRQFEFEAEAREHTEAIVRGVGNDLPAIDALIVQASQNWRIERMSKIDRNILRLSAWELRERLEIPRSVILDEAVEVAKVFGSEDSAAFVNGVLNRVADILKRVDNDRPLPNG
jgi:transcription antitermination protein NusB